MAPVINSQISVQIPAFVVSLSFHILPLAVISYGFWDEYADYLQSQSLEAYQNTTEEYDFIIVGGGSAGCVVANRLTKNGRFTVLLLEAGGNTNPMHAVPSYTPALVNIPQVDYAYYTVPQKGCCLGLRDRKGFWPRGRGLGGSSNLNAMVYQRGHKNDYDRWAELSGSEEWKFESILRNFKNVEDYHGLYYNEQYHSRKGSGVYISVSNEKRLLPEFLEAGREMGYPTKDVNGLQEASFAPLDASIKNGRRHDAYSAFLEPIINRTNLQIYRYARVLNVKLDKNKRAYGLSYERHGIRRFVKAKKEIILSAGAIDTPKVLMLSGIGPRQHLQEVGIKPIVELPVGSNLQDHVMTSLPFTVETDRSSFRPDRDITLNSITEYFGQENATGIFSTPMSMNAIAYTYGTYNHDSINKSTTPNIQLFMLPSAPEDNPMFEKIWSIKAGFLSKFLHNPQKKDGFIVDVILAKCKSRGDIKLNAKNPQDRPPLIDPKYFSDPEDMRELVKGMDFTVTMVETSKAFKRHGARLLDNHPPGCEKFPVRSMAYYECIARHVTLTDFHPCGTCSMGKGVSDPNAVVDYKLRVLKTKGLRVVDASIIPEIPNSNLNAVVYMLADKASELILRDYSHN